MNNQQPKLPRPSDQTVVSQPPKVTGGAGACGIGANMNDQINSNRRQWIEALRSGKYKQCRATMHENGHHCCLGVAECLIGDNLKYCYQTVSSWLGYEAYKASGTEVINKFINLNDKRHKSFPEIADIAEAMWFPKEDQS